MSCLAEFVTSAGRPAETVLRPYKFNRRGEGFGRSIYYQYALRAIRAYHSAGNDPEVFARDLLELRTLANTTAKRLERTRLERNVSTIEAYRRIYGNRKFKVLPNRRLEYRVGGIVVTAQPDLWVEDEGTQVLLKVGMARHKPSYVDILLTLLRKAAVSSGYEIRARNFVYLNVSTGREMTYAGGLSRFNSTFAAKAREIAGVWPRMKIDTPPPDGANEART